MFRKCRSFGCSVEPTQSLTSSGCLALKATLMISVLNGRIQREYSSSRFYQVQKQASTREAIEHIGAIRVIRL